MAHKKKHEGPVPRGNQSQRGFGKNADEAVEEKRHGAGEVESAQEQDPKRRIGDFTGTGEHSFQQPGGRNDANHADPARPACARFLLLAALATAGLLWLSYFPVNCGWLAWFALVPLLVLVRATARPRLVYLCAWLGGLAFYFPALQWMRVADPRMYFTWIGLAIYCSLYFPLTLLIVRFLDRRTRLPLALTLPVVWTALEFFRSCFGTGFSWYLVGHTQHDFLPIIQIADLAGAYGVGFLVVAVNAVLFEALYRWEWFRTRFAGPDAPCASESLGDGDRGRGRGGGAGGRDRLRRMAAEPGRLHAGADRRAGARQRAAADPQQHGPADGEPLLRPVRPGGAAESEARPDRLAGNQLSGRLVRHRRRRSETRPRRLGRRRAEMPIPARGCRPSLGGRRAARPRFRRLRGRRPYARLQLRLAP